LIVCLVDFRGAGETAPGSGRDRGSEATSISASSLMLGDPLLAGRLRDLRCVLRALRQFDSVDSSHIALWGDSLAPVNPPDVQAAVPLDLDLPQQAEPGAALLAMLGGLFEDGVSAVYTRGGMAEYRDLLRSPFVLVAHDAVVPGVIGAGDIAALSSGLSPMPIRAEGQVDAWDRAVGKEKPAGQTAAEWVIERLRAR
jgi:hypothetical protein